MHSFGYRANALITLGVTVLALMCAMASLSDNLNSPTPSAQVQVCLSLSLTTLIQFCFFFKIWGICLSDPMCLFVLSFQVLNVNWFQKQRNGNEEVINFFFFLISLNFLDFGHLYYNVLIVLWAFRLYRKIKIFN